MHIYKDMLKIRCRSTGQSTSIQSLSSKQASSSFKSDSGASVRRGRSICLCGRDIVALFLSFLPSLCDLTAFAAASRRACPTLSRISASLRCTHRGSLLEALFGFVSLTLDRFRNRAPALWINPIISVESLARCLRVGKSKYFGTKLEMIARNLTLPSWLMACLPRPTMMSYLVSP